MYRKIFLLILVDQITKLIFFTPLEVPKNGVLLTGFSHRDFFIGPLHVHSMKNYALAFSLNFGTLTNLLLIIFGLLFFGYYFWQHRQQLSKFERLAFVLIFAGAISNIIDRLYLGYVRDFLDLSLNFTFNLADVFVAVGLITILISQSNFKTKQNF